LQFLTKKGIIKNHSSGEKQLGGQSIDYWYSAEGYLSNTVMAVL